MIMYLSAVFTWLHVSLAWQVFPECIIAELGGEIADRLLQALLQVPHATASTSDPQLASCWPILTALFISNLH